ncbi:MAG TPA: STAS-like domain-containing protein [Patescibacteria group bacterium]|nr:STAS-like domain-containing protein [Patescibacteria group bacterium]
MRIELKKFGNVLVSRPAGREAYLAMSAYVTKDLGEKESIVIDFDGVKVLTPSWADEVITRLAENHSISVENTDNPTVRETLKTLEKYSGLKTV